jgi:hypothetical protein
MVFSAGVLKGAPGFHVMTTRTLTPAWAVEESRLGFSTLPMGGEGSGTQARSGVRDEIAEMVTRHEEN